MFLLPSLPSQFIEFVFSVLSSVHRRIQKWADCGKVKRFRKSIRPTYLYSPLTPVRLVVKSAQIARDLDKCYTEVDHAIERLHVN